MDYAIVDIETSGGNAAGGGSITEIAIRVFDGQTVIDRFETLVKPHHQIPPYIALLTGIDDAMVQDSPGFNDIAKDVFSMLEGRVFVAHNVNFDYCFVKQHLESAGYRFKTNQLCTVQLSRAIRPGLPSYNLSNVCSALGIELTNRHRAGGDVDATVVLFQKLLQWDREGIVAMLLEGAAGAQRGIPDALQEDFDQLPNGPGVYYFYNEARQVIYVGKARDIKKRVAQHFKQRNASLKRQNFIKEISSISCEPCGTELMAFILEALEIKWIYPKHNQALKKYEPKFGLFVQEDPDGYVRMKISGLGKDDQPVQVFTTRQGGMNKLRELTRRFGLCADLCRLRRCECCDYIDKKNNLLCSANQPPARYNEKVARALSFLKEDTGTFYIIDKGRNREEKSCIWVENGAFYGMGYIDNSADIYSLEDIKDHLTRYTNTHYIMQLIISFICKYPHKVVPVNSNAFA
ncbi:exonuclease domain-containing protein [Niabella aurantiaca]|uniref:exonuclease domain-containing protein n=1 Tax=Niabella aurantiaca TaxID=379900 RepID=UPI00036DB664|nr:exonuclease domain-containing protein [Niabella aurantiaca]